MARPERIVAVIGFGGAGKRMAEQLAAAAARAQEIALREQIRQAKELEAFKSYYNLSDEYVEKMKQASAELGISMREVMDRLEKAGAVMREASRIIGTAFQEIADLYRETLRDSRKDRPYSKIPPQMKIRPYRLEDKGFDKRRPYLYRNYRRRNK